MFIGLLRKAMKGGQAEGILEVGVKVGERLAQDRARAVVQGELDEDITLDRANAILHLGDTNPSLGDVNDAALLAGVVVRRRQRAGALCVHRNSASVGKPAQLEQVMSLLDFVRDGLHALVECVRMSHGVRTDKRAKRGVCISILQGGDETKDRLQVEFLSNVNAVSTLLRPNGAGKHGLERHRSIREKLLGHLDGDRANQVARGGLANADLDGGAGEER